MLKTIGAKSRELRTACLPYFKVGDDLVVRGSNGGGSTDLPLVVLRDWKKWNKEKQDEHIHHHCGAGADGLL